MRESREQSSATAVKGLTHIRRLDVRGQAFYQVSQICGSLFLVHHPCKGGHMLAPHICEKKNKSCLCVDRIDESGTQENMHALTSSVFGHLHFSIPAVLLKLSFRA